jgi:hypothetical protein
MKAVGFCALIFLLAAPAAPQEKADSAQSKVVALEKAWNQAYKSRDKKALSEILDPSIILVNDDGSLQSRSIFLAEVAASSPSDGQQAEPESIIVRMVGDDAAIATGVFRRMGIENGKLSVKRNRFVDTWINRNGSWVCVAAVATPILQ